jgi:hypothetical protein
VHPPPDSCRPQRAGRLACCRKPGTVGGVSGVASAEACAEARVDACGDACSEAGSGACGVVGGIGPGEQAIDGIKSGCRPRSAIGGKRPRVGTAGNPVAARDLVADGNPAAGGKATGDGNAHRAMQQRHERDGRRGCVHPRHVPTSARSIPLMRGILAWWSIHSPKRSRMITKSEWQPHRPGARAWQQTIAVQVGETAAFLDPGGWEGYRSVP